jgi:hypothetical protein
MKQDDMWVIVAAVVTVVMLLLLVSILFPEARGRHAFLYLKRTLHRLSGRCWHLE